MLKVVAILSLFAVTGCGVLDSNDRPDIPGKIVFSAKDGEGASQIYTMNADGSDVDQLTRFGPEGGGIDPSWSPDGSQIVFASNRDYYNAETMQWREDLYVINLDGNNLTRLTETGNASRPVWSSQDHLIAYEWGRGGNNVYLYEMSSGKITRIDTGMPFSGYPMWSRDGTKLLVIGRESEAGQPKIRLLDMEMEPPQILQKTSLKEKATGRDYDWYINE